MTKLLLIDDDRDILHAVQIFLKRNNFDVIALSDASKVVETVLSEQPDIILMDINLSGYDGREICRELRKQHQLSIPIILFSAISEYEVTAHQCGANGFISKPFEVKSFNSYLRSFIS